jgi:hypothetical protein
MVAQRLSNRAPFREKSSLRSIRPDVRQYRKLFLQHTEDFLASLMSQKRT